LLLDRYGKAVQPFLIVRVFLFVSSLLDRHGKAIQLIRLVRVSLSSYCCWIATAKLSSLFSSFLVKFSFHIFLLDRYGKAVQL
jgi:hypothetical protein